MGFGYRMRVATPNDPKLSDGGAGHDLCGKAEESTGHDPRSRSLERMVRRITDGLNAALSGGNVDTQFRVLVDGERVCISMPFPGDITLMAFFVPGLDGRDEPDFMTCVGLGDFAKGRRLELRLGEVGIDGHCISSAVEPLRFENADDQKRDGL